MPTLLERQFDAPHLNPASPGRGTENLDDAVLPRPLWERGLGGEGNGAVIELASLDDWAIG